MREFEKWHYNKMKSISQIYCSRPQCKQPAVVTRWYIGIGSCPILMAHLCIKCKDIPLWDEENDLIKESTVGDAQKIV